ncbi:reverse transcriptase family protein [Opitutales bacterium]|nr:reverse transcriptase family protein [Opitutales bacterium]
MLKPLLSHLTNCSDFLPFKQGEDLRNLMRERSLEFHDALQIFSAQNHYSTEQVFKNLVVEADSTQLELLAVHFRYWRKSGKLKGLRFLDQVAISAKTKANLPLCLDWLLNRRPVPRLKDFLSVCGVFDPHFEFADDDICKVFFALCGLQYLDRQGSGVHSLSLALTGIEKYWGDTGVLEVIDRQELTLYWPKITLKTLDVFNKNIQECLLQDQVVIDNVFSLRTIKALKLNPYTHPLTPESLKLKSYFLERFKPWLESNNDDDADCRDIGEYRDSKSKIFTVIQTLLEIPEYKAYVKKHLRQKKWNEGFFWIRFEWCFVEDKKRLSFLKALNVSDRETLSNRLSDKYLIELFRHSQKNVIPYFLKNGYFKKSWGYDILSHRRYCAYPSLNYYKYFLSDPSLGHSREVEKYIYSSLDTEDLARLLKHHISRLFYLDSKVYRSSIFSTFVESAILNANKCRSFPHEIFLTLLLLFGANSQIKDVLHLCDSSGRYFWLKAVRENRYRRRYRELIVKYAPDLINQYDEVEAQISLRKKGFKAKLKSVLQGKNLPNDLNVRVGSYRYFIPYIKKAFVRHPLKSAAYELALYFSIRDAAYLFYLCTLRYDNRARIQPGHQFDVLYQTYEIPKKSGGKRLITVPQERLKRLQKKILRKGFELLDLHDSAHGFRQGRSILTNAKVHVGKQCVVNVDIRSFFPNTSHQSILKACSLLFNGELSPHARYLLADICSYAGGLPMGAPTSPAIANLVMRSADQSIAKACLRHGIDYTRYADDLTFSGNDRPASVLPFVEKVIKQLGYELDPKKTNIFRRGRRQMVTGLVVNDKPNLPRRIRKQIRAAVHHKLHGKQIHWNGKPMNDQSLMGHLNCLKMVQPEEANRHKMILQNKK